MPWFRCARVVFKAVFVLVCSPSPCKTRSIHLIMFQNWAVPPSMFHRMVSCETLKCGDTTAFCLIDRANRTLVFFPDKTMYHMPTLNGKPLVREDFAKLFHEYKCDGGFTMTMVLKIERCFKSVVLSLKHCVGDFDSPHGKQLHVVMQKLDVSYTDDEDIDFQDVCTHVKRQRV